MSGVIHYGPIYGRPTGQPMALCKPFSVAATMTNDWRAVTCEKCRSVHAETSRFFDGEAEQREASGAAALETDVELANRLMRFYSVDSLYALIRMQDHHIAKLQRGEIPRGLGSAGMAVYENSTHRWREG